MKYGNLSLMFFIILRKNEVGVCKEIWVFKIFIVFCKILIFLFVWVVSFLILEMLIGFVIESVLWNLWILLLNVLVVWIYFVNVFFFFGRMEIVFVKMFFRLCIRYCVFLMICCILFILVIIFCLLLL